jgi:1,2-diacylglycerol 3-beta-glucosyltransferase
MFALSLQVIGTFLVATAGIGCAYHVFLALVALLAPRHQVAVTDNAKHRFAILIPAHNEETTITETLLACAALDYPRTQYEVFVVADNCDDRTCDVAAEHGATCLVRTDPDRRGKGFALEWAIPQILAAGCDAVLVLDADCRIDPHSLRVLDRHLSDGDQVLQLNYAVANPDESPTAFLLAAANKLENDFFYAPKSKLGLAVVLRGTGMVFHRSILEAFPWRSHSVTEDAEYACNLLEANVPARFVQNARVISPFPVQHRQLIVQRSRWIGGGMALAKRQGLRMLARGLIERRFQLFDAGLTLLLLSRPLIILQLLLTIAIGVAAWMASPDYGSVTLLLSSFAVLTAYLAYAMIGVASLGVNSHRFRLLLSAPWTVVRYLWLGLATMTVGAPTAWNKTPRVPGIEKP